MNPVRLDFSYLALILSFLTCSSFAGDPAPAWTGFTLPGSRTPASFTPYYVPPGTKAHDSSSPLVKYSGEWLHIHAEGYVRRSSSQTTDPKATVIFSFHGTGIEWFGNIDNRHGMANALIDDSLAKQVNSWGDNAVPLKQQRLFWSYDLPCGKHTLKLENSGGALMDVDAFVVTQGSCSPSTLLSPNIYLALRQANPSPNHSYTGPSWKLHQKGSTGVNAMQLAIISPTVAIILDKVEHNPLTIDDHPAWAAVYNLRTHDVRPLGIKSNSFCAGGTFLGNGTLVNVGGNQIVGSDYGDLDGSQSIRLIDPCEFDTCTLFEDPVRLKMTSPRWYPTTVRISDGSVLIIGGSRKAVWLNNEALNNPTIEYFPPKHIHGSKGSAILMPFLAGTLPANLFPIAFFLPNGLVFICANRDCILYDWVKNIERQLPRIPNGVHVTYPFTGTGLLLPLSPEHNYEPSVLLCGGSALDDQTPRDRMSARTPASTQCTRMVLTEAGIAAGWQVETMPEARMMPDAVLLPTGKVVIVNGGATGLSGYGNVRGRTGQSNADNPVFTPVLYDPDAAIGQRFSRNEMPTSGIPRLYHSVASLTASGSIMIAGSNPNLDRSEVKYATEYSVEWLDPPYMSMERPVISGYPTQINFGQQVILKYQFSTQGSEIKVALMDLGFITHSSHANSRLVYLSYSLQGNDVTITGPPNSNVYPPGPGFLFLIIGDAVSQAVKVMIGSGQLG